MERLGPLIRVRGLLGLVACVAVNLWLFRLGMLPGLVGLNVTKHVAIAALCRGAGVNRSRVGVISSGLTQPAGTPDRAPSPVGDA